MTVITRLTPDGPFCGAGAGPWAEHLGENCGIKFDS